MMAISSPAATWMISSRGWKESSPINSVSTARRSWPRSRSQRAISPASSWMYSMSAGLLVTGPSCVARVTPERGHRRRVTRTCTDYTLDDLDGPPAAAPFVGEPGAAGGRMRKGSLLTQERLGVLAGEASHGQEFDASLARGNHHRDRPVVHLGELGCTSRAEGHHADASGLPEVLTSDRHHGVLRPWRCSQVHPGGRQDDHGDGSRGQERHRTPDRDWLHRRGLQAVLA